MRRLIPILFLLLPTLAAAQDGADVVRGRVVAPDSTPVAGAKVTITDLQSLASRTAETNSQGYYTAVFLGGTGQYVIAVKAIGYTPVTGRVRRNGDSKVLIANVALAMAPVQLDSVTVVAKNPSQATGGIGAREQALPGALFSLNPADFDDLVAQVPGVVAIPGVNGGPGGYSILGVSPDQNNMTLDGSTYNGSTLPPGAIESATISTTSYNPARGGYAGGQVAITTRGGNDQFQATFGSALADPHLAWADPRAPTPVPRNLRLNGAASGPIVRGKLYYSLGAQDNTTTSDLLSLVSLNQAQRDQYGITADTVAALRGTLEQLGVPITTAGIPNRTTQRQRSVLARFDANPSATTTLTITGISEESRQLGAGISPLSFPSLAGTNGSRNMRGQISFASYVHGFLDELSTTVQRSSNNGGPIVWLPHGQVRVGAAYQDGNTGITQLVFGGGSSGITSSLSRTWETKNEISWLTTDSRHKVSFGQSLKLNWTSANTAADPWGTFSYQSMDDLAANRPASFSRMLSTSAQSTSSREIALWVGGESRFRRNQLQFQYGLRLDAASSGTRPGYNPAIDSLFGHRTDFVPAGAALSPRLGFSWTLGSGRNTEMWRQPITITGGVGGFRGVVPPNRIAGIAQATGLANTIRQLTCVGDATPTPDWQGYAANPDAVPSQCLDGTAPVEYSSDVPNVQMFDPSYRPPTSWRGNLEVRGLQLHGWQLGIGGTYSRTVGAESAIDLNLRRTPQFTLADEGRPVFVRPDGIVTSTGAVAPGMSRISDRFGVVNSYVSDLGSRAVQLNLTVTPPKPIFGKLPLSLQYTYSNVQEQGRGFGGSTAGDPLVAEWAPAAAPVHQFRLQTSFALSYATLQFATTLSSGTRYTPMVVGDVNGDGQANDRAFIYSPTSAPDAALAQQMSDLLASATPSTRACLEAQVGRIAGRNSCATGWQLRPDTRLDLNIPLPQQFGLDGLGNRLHISVTTVNSVGALFRLLGLANTSLGRLSGANYPIDPALLYVDGFDPATQRFKYRINQQFGEGQPTRIRASRFTAPFQVQIGADLRFGAAVMPERQMATQLGLVNPDRNAPPPTREELRERIRRFVGNPISAILALRDSLLLNDEQIAKMEAIDSVFRVDADSILSPVLEYVVQKGSKVKDKDLSKRIGKVSKKIYPRLFEALAACQEVLRPEQRDRLPPYFKQAAAVGGKKRSK